MKYDDLPLEEIVKNLRKDFPEINFILPEELGQIIVRLELRDVGLSEITQAIQIACRSENILIQQENSERLFSFQRNPRAAANAENKPVLRAFNLTGYLATRPPAEQESAIKMIYELAEQAVHLLESARQKVSLPRIEMHLGAKMLMAVGTPDQLQVLEEIVSSLPGMESTFSNRAYRQPTANPDGEVKLDAKFLQRYGQPGGSTPTTSR